jgi:hypothetical protein
MQDYRNVRWLRDRYKIKTQLFFFEDDVRFLAESTGIAELLPFAEPRLAGGPFSPYRYFPLRRRTDPAIGFEPETATPGGISTLSSGNTTRVGSFL